MTVAELQSLDCGTLKNEKFKKQISVPGTKLITLPEFFVFVKKQKEKFNYEPNFNVELIYHDGASEKHKQLAAQIMVKTIEDADLVDRTVVQSFSIDILSYVKKLNPKIKTSALFNPGYIKGFFMLVFGTQADRMELIEKSKKVNADIISPHYVYVTDKFVQVCHNKGLAVIPWTVNKEKDIVKMLNLGVDGIISDYPDLLRSLYDNWKVKKMKRTPASSN
jgi:glycerophosphoryl diester phosphodiesterase